jgi:membrane fusion protein (multidrug efflux system)
MITAFTRSYARLMVDRGWLVAGFIAAGLVALVAWAWWATHADITVYEVSAGARLELDAATYPVQAPLVGRVVAATLRVGQTVHAGDMLVEIDPLPNRLQLEQEQMRARAIEPELARLRSQIAAEEDARAAEQHAAQVGAEEAVLRIRVADADAQYAQGELTRIESLHAQGLITDRDRARARADATRTRATVMALETTARRIPQDQRTRDRERDVRIARLRREIASLEGQHAVVSAGIARVAYDVERRRVRAPIDGTIGESAVLRPGAVVEEGDKLASIVPTGRLIIAAQFPAQRALGRIRTGQPASLHLDGFPWAEFGSVTASVARVGQEIRDGHVRVELDIDPHSPFRGPLVHGMPGSLEIVVERATPAALLVRAAGQALTARP